MESAPLLQRQFEVNHYHGSETRVCGVKNLLMDGKFSSSPSFPSENETLVSQY